MGYAAGSLPANVDTIQNVHGLVGEYIRLGCQRSGIPHSSGMWRITISRYVFVHYYDLLDVKSAAASSAFIKNSEV